MENQNEQPIMDSEEVDNVQMDDQLNNEPMNNEPMDDQQIFDQMNNSQMDVNENFTNEESNNLDSMIENVEKNAIAQSSNKWSGMLPKIIILLVCLALAYFLYTKKDMILEKIKGFMPSKKVPAPAASNSA